MSDNETTEPKIFIIESLDFDDEKKNLFEGHIISSILQLSVIESKYFYIRTKKEFLQVLRLFNESNFRYLHISCHGGANKDSIWTTKMSREALIENMQKVVNTFEEPMNYYSISNNYGFKYYLIKSNIFKPDIEIGSSNH